MHLLLQSFENEASFSPETKFTTDTTMRISISERMKLTQQVCWFSFRQTRTIQKSQQTSIVAENHWWRTKNFISNGIYWTTTSKLYSIKRNTSETKCRHWVSAESKGWNTFLLAKFRWIFEKPFRCRNSIKDEWRQKRQVTYKLKNRHRKNHLNWSIRKLQNLL